MRKITSVNFNNPEYSEEQLIEFFKNDVTQKTLGYNIAIKMLMMNTLSQEGRNIIIHHYLFCDKDRLKNLFYFNLVGKNSPFLKLSQQLGGG